MKKTYQYTYLILLLTLTFVSCEKYLDIAPKSSLSEDEMFESEIGFQQALAGIYANMASRELYGDRLSMGFVSALGQNYSITSTQSPFYSTSRYDYTSGEVMLFANQIWKASYTAIAGTNNILKHLQTNSNTLNPEAYDLIKGETLGLRAYLHFELLRLFGPIYDIGASEKAIPYRTSIDHLSTIPSTTDEVIRFALEDLEEAAVLLKKSDPIVLEGTVNRQIKLNYYGVKALQARIKLYKNDKSGAYNAAKEVLESQQFPFVVHSTVGGAPASKDRLFKSELIFALRVREIATWAEDLYFVFNGNISTGMTRPLVELDQIYENSSTDLRRQNLFETSGGFTFPSKFWQTNTGTLAQNRLDQLVPLIRISEMYYIAAETAETPTEKLEYLNKVRHEGRNIPILNPNNLTDEYLQNEITKEYQKEFYAEGQLFYYYKRLKYDQIMFYNGSVSPAIYRLPIPDDELEFNPNY
ncbi:RagB/SusD family nutrient uptake outer membrane protein [Sphingobacterium corticis]|uniref:RagB/SusD family nutrient uptake outer membrane protein n=1 Tax=Sphingobacterium corticis TaxID=1812823 RepID=A0ABW5NGH4_9SPHI